jgi:hypothetical protein
MPAILLALALLLLPLDAVAQLSQPAQQVPAETVFIAPATIAAQVLQWVIAAFGSVLASVLVAWILKGLKKVGVDVDETRRARLKEMVVNGLNLAAADAQRRLAAGATRIDVKNQIVSAAISYAQKHGADTIQALGLDPQSGAAVEALRAWAETAIRDPATPTPVVATPAVPVPAP